MAELYDLIFSNAGAALLVPLLIFFVSVVLIVRKLIGFGILVTFLVFAIITGVVIANYDLCKSYLCTDDQKKVDAVEESMTTYTTQILDAFEDMKNEVVEGVESFRYYLEGMKGFDNSSAEETEQEQLPEPQNNK